MIVRPRAPGTRRATQALRAARFAVTAAALVVLAACTQQSVQEQIRSVRQDIEKKDYASASVKLRAALQKDGNSAELRFLFGQTLLKRGDTASAELELGKARDAGYDDNQVLPLLARAMVANGKSRLVATLFAATSLSDPKAGADLLATIASANIVLERSDQAAQQIEAALKLDPKNVQALYLKARQATTESIDAALSLLGPVIAAAPERADILHFKGELLWLGKGDTKAAGDVFRQAIALEPRYLPSYGALATISLQRQDTAAFRQLVADLTKVLPQHPETKLYQAQVALLDKDTGKAREMVQQLLKVAPDSVRVLELAGTIEIGQGSLVLAETHLNKAVQLEPARARVRPMLAETYLRLGRPDRALKVLQPLLERKEPAVSVLALAAEAHLHAGNASAAEGFYRRAATRSPQDPRVKTALALMQLAKGEAEPAFLQLESAAEADPSAYSSFALISARMLKGDLNAALADADRLVAKTPDKAFAHELRGRLQFQLGDAAAARASFEKALSVDPAFFPAVAQLAKLDIDGGQLAQAAKRFEALLAKEPRNYRARLGLIDTRERGGAPAAEITKALQDVVSAFPSDLAPRQALVRHLTSRGDTATALIAAQEAVSALPDSMDALEMLGRAQIATRDFQQALTAFGRIAANDPLRPQPHYMMAEVHLRRKDATASAASLRRALEISPDFLPAQKALIELAMTGRKFDEAVSIARAIQKQRPKEPVGFLLEADVQQVKQAIPAAIEATQAAFTRRRSTATAVKLVMLYRAADRRADADRLIAQWEKESPNDAAFQSQMGNQAIERKDYVDAEARFRRVLALRKDDVTALNNLAWLMAREGKPGAVELARRANELSPGRASLMDTLALALASGKALDEAIQWQRKAVALAPEIPTYRLNLARFLLEKGDKGAAKEELDALAKLGPAFTRQDEVRQLAARL